MLVELLDDAEDVIPPPAVQAGRMVAQLVEDLVHFERGGDRLDEHRGANAAARNAQLVLGHQEHVVPEPGLQVAFHLGKVEIGPEPRSSSFRALWKKNRPKSTSEPGHGLAVQPDVLFRQVPAARPHHERGRLLVESILFSLGTGEADRAADGFAEVPLALDQVVPGRRIGVLEVGHVDTCAGVQRVDDHLAVRRPGDLHAAVLQVVGHGRHGPVGPADVLGFGKEVGKLPRVELALPTALRESSSARWARTPAAVFPETATRPGQDLLALVGSRRANFQSDRWRLRLAHGIDSWRGESRHQACNIRIVGARQSESTPGFCICTKRDAPAYFVTPPRILGKNLRCRMPRYAHFATRSWRCAKRSPKRERGCPLAPPPLASSGFKRVSFPDCGKLATPLHIHAAVDRDDLAGDVAGQRRSQEQDGRRHLFRPAQPPYGRHGLDAVNATSRKVLGHVRLDKARGHGIDRHALSGDLAGQRHGETDQSGLGHGVVDLAEIPGLARRRT